MKLLFNYGNDVITLPACAAERIEKASKRDIYLLFLLASEKELRDNFGDIGIVTEFCEKYGVSSVELTKAVKFWSAGGILNIDNEQIAIEIPDKNEEVLKAEAEARLEKLTAEIVADSEENQSVAEVVGINRKKILDPAAKVPEYTTEQISEILEKRTGTAQLIDDCQRTIGRMFSSHEISVTLGLIDYLNIDDEYLLVLFAHCKNIDKTSIRYIEKLAISLYDEGYTSADVLQSRLKKLEIYLGAEAQIRTMFGINTRALSKKEKESLDRWLNTYGYGIEIIRKAYEITVDTISKPSISYTNTILTSWHDEKLTTVEEIDAYLAAKAGAAKQLSISGSFDTDDFFEAAVQRSYAAQRTENDVGKSKDKKDDK